MNRPGIEFDYPAGWAFDGGEHQSRGYFIQLYSWDWKPGDPIEPLPVGGTVLSVTVQLWDPKNDLEAFINQRKLAWDSSGISILSEERVLLTGNRPAAQFIVQGIDGSQAFFLLTTNGEDYLVLSGNGDLNLLAEIAHTLRSTPQMGMITSSLSGNGNYQNLLAKDCDRLYEHPIIRFESQSYTNLLDICSRHCLNAWSKCRNVCKRY